MVACPHTNIPSKHSSWEPAGGELKHCYWGGFIAGLWTKAISLINSRVTKTDWGGIVFSWYVLTEVLSGCINCAQFSQDLYLINHFCSCCVDSAKILFCAKLQV